MNFEKMTKPFFSIIIPSLNEEINLPILLTSIKNQTNFDFEILVVDSHSTDKTPEKAIKYEKLIPRFKFISHKTKNVSQARNYGAIFSRGEFLIFLDADVELAKDFISEIKNKIQEFNLDMTTVWNRPKTKSLAGKVVLYLLNINMSLFEKIKPAANGPCIIIKKELFDKIGRFDEEIVFGEDFDLVQKAHKKKANFKVFQKPILYVSTRRFEKEGLLYSLYKSIKAILYQLFFGPIRKPIFDYEMGGQYYEKH
jgi:glycosyltransferase involved in cell wall biosynthesis